MSTVFDKELEIRNTLADRILGQLQLEGTIDKADLKTLAPVFDNQLLNLQLNDNLDTYLPDAIISEILQVLKIHYEAMATTVLEAINTGDDETYQQVLSYTKSDNLLSLMSRCLTVMTKQAAAAIVAQRLQADETEQSVEVPHGNSIH